MPHIIFSILLLVAGLVAIFYFRPKMNKRVMEMKYMQTKKISELKESFSQMRQNGLEDNYREYVELKGTAVADEPVVTPFSNQPVVYCESTLSQVTEQRESYQDSDGNWQERVNRNENVISNEKTSQYIYLKDSSDPEKVTLEINASGCSPDIPKTFDRFEPRNNLARYSFFNSFSFGGFGADTLGFRMVEKTIKPNQQMYVLGEAYLSGDEIHIGTPSDHKNPFVVTTKSEDDMINTSSKNSMIALIGGIAAITCSVLVFVLIR